MAVPVLVLMAAAGLGVVAPQPSSASCAGSQLVPATTSGPADTVPALVLHPGRSATVEGRFFHNGCEDSYSTGGCGRGKYDDPQSPMQGVVLTLRQGEREWPLGSADAADRDRGYAISWAVEIPTEARPGPAVLLAGSTQREVILAR